MKEVWKPVEGYEDLYQISNLGRVKSLKRRTKSGFYNRIMMLKPSEHTDGYLQVVLYKNGQRKTYKVHRLVANAFLPRSENKTEVNHLDGVKKNNSVDNLSWCTRKENMKHAGEYGLMSSESFRDVEVYAQNKEGEILTFKNKKTCSEYFGFKYWWFHNQVRYFGDPFQHNGFLIGTKI